LALPFFHLDQAFGFMEAVLVGIDFMHKVLDTIYQFPCFAATFAQYVNIRSRRSLE
jgi:hypothetical protein